MNRTIELIAEGVIINSRILEKLLDQLPHDVQQAVATIVAPVAPVVPVTAEPKIAKAVGTTAPAPVVPNIVARVPPFVETAPVEPAPVPNIVALVEPAPVAPAASLFVEPTPAPAAPVVPAAPAPFDNASGMVSYVVDSYRVLGGKGSEIQTVLNDLGYVNINEVKPEHYSALYNAIEALKK